MKRSEINQYIKQAIEFFDKNNFKLPVWATATPEEWEKMAATGNYTEIIENQLGWDITDFAKNDFLKEGLSLFTVRNGSQKQGAGGKTYCEKIMISYVNQETPMHFHWNKMEDIINRGGGNILIRVYNSDENEDFDVTDVTVSCDGVEVTVPAGTQIRLTPGQSITIPQGLYHDFEVEKGSGNILLGEVSMCNDDECDNRFYEQMGRFPAIEEDEPPYRLLCTEYPVAK